MEEDEQLGRAQEQFAQIFVFNGRKRLGWRRRQPGDFGCDEAKLSLKEDDPFSIERDLNTVCYWRLEEERYLLRSQFLARACLAFRAEVEFDAEFGAGQQECCFRVFANEGAKIFDRAWRTAHIAPVEPMFHYRRSGHMVLSKAITAYQFYAVMFWLNLA
jgi:hypothetical protein